MTLTLMYLLMFPIQWLMDRIKWALIPPFQSTTHLRNTAAEKTSFDGELIHQAGHLYSILWTPKLSLGHFISLPILSILNASGRQFLVSWNCRCRVPTCRHFLIWWKISFIGPWWLVLDYNCICRAIEMHIPSAKGNLICNILSFTTRSSCWLP